MTIAEADGSTAGAVDIATLPEVSDEALLVAAGVAALEDADVELAGAVVPPTAGAAVGAEAGTGVESPDDDGVDADEEPESEVDVDAAADVGAVTAAPPLPLVAALAGRAGAAVGELPSEPLVPAEATGVVRPPEVAAVVAACAPEVAEDAEVADGVDPYCGWLAQPLNAMANTTASEESQRLRRWCERFWDARADMLCS